MSNTETKTEDPIKQQEDLNVNTPYDDVFRTMNEDCPRFVIPLINEIFGTDYPINAEIEFLADKHIINLPGRKHIKRETDSNISITDADENARYHIECQSTNDNDISIRVYEYDARTAMNGEPAHLKSPSAMGRPTSRDKLGTMNGGELIGDEYHVRFPHSAVLYLRSSANTPRKLHIVIETPGGNVSYPVPVIKVKQFGLEEIFEKKLWFLIPFYLFKYEADFPTYETDEKRRREMMAEFREIAKRLEQLCNAGKMTSRETGMLLELTGDVAQNLASNYENIRNEVKEIMGGKVLNYRTKTAWNEGLSQGVSQGRAAAITEAILNLMNSMKLTAEQAMDALKIPQEDRETYLSELNDEEELREG